MLYPYKCGVCGNKQDEFRIVDKRDDLLLCEECGSVCHRIYDFTRKNAETQGYYSRTMGVHPAQVAEEKELHPDWKFHPDGRLWVESLQEQRKKAKALGMVSFDDI